MDETAGVKHDILDFLRANRLDVGDPLHEGPFYAQQKAAFHAAVEELIAEGLSCSRMSCPSASATCGR